MPVSASNSRAPLPPAREEFADFVLECARGFGALATLRDQPEKPIPDEFTPDESSLKMARQAEYDMDRLARMTAEEAGEAAEVEYERELKEWNESEAKTKATRAR